MSIEQVVATLEYNRIQAAARQFREKNPFLAEALTTSSSTPFRSSVSSGTTHISDAHIELLALVSEHCTVHEKRCIEQKELRDAYEKLTPGQQWVRYFTFRSPESLSVLPENFGRISEQSILRDCFCYSKNQEQKMLTALNELASIGYLVVSTHEQTRLFKLSAAGLELLQRSQSVALDG
jgi:hypothetical protein